jgi:putative DNA primase/helicase
VWESLLAIADMAGGRWASRARAAAIDLASGENAEESAGVQLLADTRLVFEREGVDKISSADLAAALAQLEESPWGDWHGKPLEARGLARILRPYKIKPKGLRIGDETPRGYERASFRRRLEPLHARRRRF